MSAAAGKNKPLYLVGEYAGTFLCNCSSQGVAGKKKITKLHFRCKHSKPGGILLRRCTQRALCVPVSREIGGDDREIGIKPLNLFFPDTAVTAGAV